MRAPRTGHAVIACAGARGCQGQAITPTHHEKKPAAGAAGFGHAWVPGLNRPWLLPALQAPTWPSAPSWAGAGCRAALRVSSASARRMVSWIRRCIGRAPMSGSKPFLAKCLRSVSVKVTSTFFSASCVFQLQQELVHHAQDDLLVERLEVDDGIQPVAELGREQALDVAHFVARLARVGKADGRLVHGLGARVRGHDDQDVAEVGLAAVVVRQRAMVHDLQQHVEDVRVRLLDFVEQQHRVRLLRDGFGQRPPWSKPT